MSKLEYEDFSARLYGKTFRSALPSHGHFELTFRCPLKCGFCYCSCYTSPEHTRRELETEEVFRILNEAAEGGCLWITLSGGDPFIRKDFRQIYDQARNLGMIVNILCSGILLTEDWLRHLKANPPLKIELPLYGSTAQTHEAVSGRPGSFQAITRNILRLVEAGVPLRIKTKITSQNLHEVAEVEHFVEKELGLTFYPNYMIYPRLNGDKEPLRYRLAQGQIVELERAFGKAACESTTETAHADPASTNLFRCAAGINSFYINPYGELNFCTYVRDKSWDLRKGSIREGVRFLRGELLGLSLPTSSACGTCSIQASCQNCPGHAVLETGSMEGKSDYLCDLNHAVREKAKHAT